MTNGLDPLEPWFMTVFLWLMRAREEGRRATARQVAEGTGIEPERVEASLETLRDHDWVRDHADGCEITADGGLAFYAIISGGQPPAPGEV